MGVPTNLIPTPITGLPEYTGSETIGYLPYVIDGRTFKVQFSNIAAAGAVPASRVIAAGTGLAGGGDLSANRVISIAAGGVGFDQLAVSGVAQGTYGSGSAIPVLTVDAKGRVTSATTAALNVTGFVPTSRTILAGDGLVGGGSLASNLTFSANFSAATPSALGTASAGTAITVSRGDHVHPAVDLSDTTQTQGALPLGRGGTGDALSPVAGAVVYSTGTKFALTDPGLPGQFLLSNGTGEPQWQTVSGSGTVTSVSVATANGFAGTVANPNIAASITLQTTVNGILKGDGTGVSASIITDNGTNVGIGTASPTEKLSVNGNAIVGVEGGAGYVFGRRTGNIMAGEDVAGSYLFAGINVTAPANLTIGRMNTDTIFQTNGGLERMRIASGGNVGIGTSAPLSRIHTYGGAGGINAIFESSTAADTRIEMKNNATRAGYLYWDANEVRTLADTSRSITSFTGGAERMRISATGDVGIGTTTPAARLHVVNTYTNTSDLTIVASSSIPGINLRTLSSGRFSIMANYSAANTTGFVVGTGTANPSTVAMHIDHATGNVGVGTATPNAALTIGTADPRISFFTGDNNYAVYRTGTEMVLSSSGNTRVIATTGVVAISAGGSERMRIDSAGNVGIGTSSPSTRLSVVGDARFTNTANTQVNIGGGTGQAQILVEGPSATTSFNILHNGAAAYLTQNGGTSGFQFRNTAGDYTFFTGAGHVERMRMLADGKLGIGMTPTYKLDIQDASASSGIVARFKNSGSTGAAIQLFQDTVGSAIIGLPAGSTSLRFTVGTATEALVLDLNGNAGIGTSSFGTSAAKVLGMANATAPTTSPAGMGQLYVEGGALKFRGSSGTVTTIAPA